MLSCDVWEVKHIKCIFNLLHFLSILIVQLQLTYAIILVSHTPYSDDIKYFQLTMGL